MRRNSFHGVLSSDGPALEAGGRAEWCPWLRGRGTESRPHRPGVSGPCLPLQLHLGHSPALGSDLLQINLTYLTTERRFLSVNQLINNTCFFKPGLCAKDMTSESCNSCV